MTESLRERKGTQGGQLGDRILSAWPLAWRRSGRVRVQQPQSLGARGGELARVEG